MGYNLATATGVSFTVNLTSLNTGINAENDASVVRYNDGPIFTNVSLTAQAQTMLGTWAGGKSSSITTFDGKSVAVYDFQRMTNGYLPAGTMFYLWDLDTSTTGEGPVTISSSATSQFLDLTWLSDGSVSGAANSVTPPNVHWDSNTSEFSIVAAGTRDNDADDLGSRAIRISTSWTCCYVRHPPSKTCIKYQTLI